MHEYTPFDKGMAEAFYLHFFGDKEPITFQFPPKIMSDGRKGEWQETNIPSAEPTATYLRSGPREITMTATYIVDGGVWTTNKISETVRRIRGYFARVRDIGNARNMIIVGQFCNHGDPDHAMTFRLKGVDVKHGETLVTHCDTTSEKTRNYKEAYPLRTDITLDLRMWTNGGVTNVVQNFAGLKLKEHPKWY